MHDSATSFLQPRIMRVNGRTVSGAVQLECEELGSCEASRYSAALHPLHIEYCLANKCDALVQMTACGKAVVLQFIVGPEGLAGPQVLHCDELRLGTHGRLRVEGQTLAIRAHHLDLRAEGEQRLRGASIHIG